MLVVIKINIPVISKLLPLSLRQVLLENTNTIDNFVKKCMASNDPLHGKTLEMILNHLVDHFGWKELATLININCFKSNPSIKSSLTFLRKTPWARKKVEDLYISIL